jgi:membrane-associated protease RseP (regulator of RpoE activity)
VSVAVADVEGAPGEDDTEEPPPTRSETMTRVVGLVAGTAAVTLLILAAGGWPWLVVVGSILVIIMLHECGHFVTAKWSGMRATEFFVGFGPKLWSIRRGETEYGIKAIPAGGYVKILGMTSLEELDPTDEPRSFVNQSTPKRVLVASAGSLVHLLLALLLAFTALFWFGKPIVTNTAQVYGLSSVSGVVLPAQAAGLKPGDVLVSIDGVKTTMSNADHQIRSAGGKALSIVVRRGTRDLSFSVTPKLYKSVVSYPIIGVELAPPVVLTHPGLASSATGTTSLVWSVADETLHVFATAFSPSGIASLFHQVTNSKAGAAAKASGTGSVSIYGASELIADAARAGVEPLLGILISLNISLGILNMLPMLPLDGGHVAIALYERIRTRKGKARYRADVRKLMPVVYAFLAFLALFVVGKMYLDIAHGTVNPFG